MARSYADERLAEGIDIGRREGIDASTRRALRLVLTSRFGPLPRSVEERIDAAPTEALDAALTSAARAQGLDEALADLGGAASGFSESGPRR